MPNPPHTATIVTLPDSPSVDTQALYRRITWRIVPLAMIGYVVAYIDRVNVGFAKLQFMHDLGFSDAVYGLGAGLFFAGYFLFEVPSNLRWAPG